jgi:hypothetical protein
MAKPPESDDNEDDLTRFARLLAEIEKESESGGGPVTLDIQTDTETDKPLPNDFEVPGDDEGVAPKD